MDFGFCLDAYSSPLGETVMCFGLFCCWTTFYHPSWHQICCIEIFLITHFRKS